MEQRSLKRIAFHLNCLEQGGAERVVSNLANRFVQEGIEVYIATEWEGEDEFQIDERIHRVHVGLRPEDENRNHFSKILRRTRYLKEFLLETKPDVLVAFAQKALYRALMAEKGTNVPVVISIRTDPVGHYESIVDRFIIAHYFDRAAGCVYQTIGQKEFFKPHLQEKSRIILNPVNEKYFDVTHPAQKEKSVVQHARLVDFKNQPMLVEAFLKVHEKHPDYVLRIYGPDSFDGTKEILEDLIQKNNAQDFVFLMGGSDALEQEIPKGEIYAFSSDWEGMPNSLLEAMAMGMPVVATDCPCGGPATVITNEENALLVPVKDASAMEGAINRLIEDKALAAKLAANAAKLKDIANADVIFTQWKEYLEEILCSHTTTTEKS